MFSAMILCPWLGFAWVSANMFIINQVMVGPAYSSDTLSWPGSYLFWPCDLALSLSQSCQISYAIWATGIICLLCDSWPWFYCLCCCLGNLQSIVFWLPDFLVMFLFVLDHVNLTIIYCHSYYFSHVYILSWPYDFGQDFSFVSQDISSLFVYFVLAILFLANFFSHSNYINHLFSLLLATVFYC